MNDYLRRMNLVKQQAYQDGVVQGVQFGASLATVAFNHACGIGRKRIKEAEVEINRLVNDIIKVDDPDWTEAQLKKALDQIK